MFQTELHGFNFQNQTEKLSYEGGLKCLLSACANRSENTGPRHLGARHLGAGKFGYEIRPRANAFLSTFC